MTPMMMRNNANPEHMTSFTLPKMPTILFVVMSVIRLGKPASNRQAGTMIRMGNSCFSTCILW